MAPLLAALRQLGAAVACPEIPEAPPLVIEGVSLLGGPVRMSGALSSQFISGVLMAGPMALNGVHVMIEDHVVQRDYVAMTLDMMETFGAVVEADPDLSDMRVESGGYRPADVTLEADASTATYFLALAAVTAGTVTVTNLGTATRQPDLRFIDVLERMGCAVVRAPGRVTVQGPARLTGGLDVDMRPLSDATLTLAAIAPFADGPVAISGVEHIRRHESDRIAVICRALADLGVPVEERADGLTVHPARPRWGAMATHDDHRVAMALAVLGAAAEGVRLHEPGCVSKTCPPFFERLAALGVGVSRPAADGR
jgi:3-phosphoshikimate 1-carboxyvinyltransferase